MLWILVIIYSSYVKELGGTRLQLAEDTGAFINNKSKWRPTEIDWFSVGSY